MPRADDASTLASVIDLHSHILPGVDDGAATLEEALEIARSAVEDGVRVLAATPHVRDDYPTTPEMMEARLAEVRAALAREGVELDVRPGGEVALDRLLRLSPEELRRFGLGGNPAYVLLEFPYYGWPLELGERVFALRAEGITAVIAHPERNSDVQARPDRLRELVDAGALVQLTAASLDGRLGRRSRDAAHALLELELAHLVASDAHAPSLRAAGLASAAASLDDADLARWLTVDVPRAVVDGTALPERPAARQARGWRRRLRSYFATGSSL